MFEINWQNALIVLLVTVVAYLVYKKVEGFADENKHHHHHTGHHHTTHHHAHHGAKAEHDSKWNRIPQMDFPGYDVYHNTVNSVEECEELCEAEPGCTHSTFDGQNTCYLKSPNGISQGQYVAGFKRVDGTYARYPNNDLSGFDLPGSGNSAQTLQDCESVCNNTNNCLNYTYGIKNQACYIKGPEHNNMPGLVLSLKP